jgi:hypothetical protein
MENNRLLFILLCIVLMAQLLIQCESPKSSLRQKPDQSGKESTWNTDIRQNANDMLEKGRAVFRFETFGDEAFWTDELQLHKAIADKGAGGIGEGLSPKAALDTGTMSRNIASIKYRDRYKQKEGYDPIPDQVMK